MPKTTIREWVWSQHLPPEVLEDFQKLFALPEKWRADDADIHPEADDLEAILGKSS